MLRMVFDLERELKEFANATADSAATGYCPFCR